MSKTATEQQTFKEGLCYKRTQNKWTVTEALGTKGENAGRSRNLKQKPVIFQNKCWKQKIFRKNKNQWGLKDKVEEIIQILEPKIEEMEKGQKKLWGSIQAVKYPLNRCSRKREKIIRRNRKNFSELGDKNLQMKNLLHIRTYKRLLYQEHHNFLRKEN